MKIYLSLWKPTVQYFQIAFVSLALMANLANAETLVDFEDQSTYSPGSGGKYYNGNSGSGTNSNGWTSHDVFFSNSFTETPNFSFWSGWSYSNVVDPTTPGFFNEFASAAGGGSGTGGSVDPTGNYAIAFVDSSVNPDGTPIGRTTFTFNRLFSLSSVDITNTTYVRRYVSDGLDGFGTPDYDPLAVFGSGDFLRLSITGYDDTDGSGNSTGTVNVPLATDSNYVLTDWATIDLSTFAASRSLAFSLQSSQFTAFSFGAFIDTPTYFALDNLRITAAPEPGSGAAIIGIVLGAAARRRRR